MIIPKEPIPPIQWPYEDDEDFEDRLEKYYRDYDHYQIACDMAIDRQRDRECERALFGEEL
jgi:hypothetical protein